MENIDENPLLKPEDPFEGYKKSIEEIQKNPQYIEFTKLCYELFEINSQGKKFIEHITERYIMPSLVARGSPTYQLDVLWEKGFKEFGLMLIDSIKSYQQRIKAGNA